jgi:hypothetical protein
MASAANHARHDQYRPALDTCRNSRGSISSSLFGVDTARSGFRRLLSHHTVDHSVVATDITQEDKFRVRALKNDHPQITQITQIYF